MFFPEDVIENTKITMSKTEKIFWLVLILIPLICLLLLIIEVAYAAKISAPPPLPEEPASEQLYLQQIYNNWQKLEVATTNPDGARRGDIGEMILLNSSGTYYLEICISSGGGTTWQGVLLLDTP